MESEMTKVLRDGGNGRELVLTNDRVNPFGLRISGTVVVQSWSRALMERLLGDESFSAAASRELEEL
jgi:hypothetical protein